MKRKQGADQQEDPVADAPSAECGLPVWLAVHQRQRALRPAALAVAAVGDRAALTVPFGLVAGARGFVADAGLGDVHRLAVVVAGALRDLGLARRLRLRLTAPLVHARDDALLERAGPGEKSR